MTGRAFRKYRRERILAAAGLAPVVMVAGGINGVALLAIIGLVLVATIPVEHPRLER